MSDFKFHTKWNVWIRDADNNTDWSINSYEKIYTIESVEDMWKFINSMGDLTSKLIFIFRDGILPIYECPKNKNGGQLSYGVKNANELKNEFCKLVMLLLGEQLHENPEIINGIQFVKKRTLLVKIWISTEEKPLLKMIDNSEFRYNPNNKKKNNNYNKNYNNNRRTNNYNNRRNNNRRKR